MANVRIGYACVNTQLPSSSRTCRLKGATPERILDLARENLSALDEILVWNARHGVRLFRISSEIIPFGSHPINQLPWWDGLAPELGRIGERVRSSGMRVSMHPGQYTVLNSLRGPVVQNSVLELEYHARFLGALGLDWSHKIILHVGGAFGDKKESLQRFVRNYSLLSESAGRRLVLENDEKSYSLADALSAARQVGIPVVFDVFHHGWNPSFPENSLRDNVELAASTWGDGDGPPKLHYSDQWPGKPPGSHSFSVDLDEFERFYRQVKDLTLDVMLEVKDKEQSVLAIFHRFPELSGEIL